jgi:hypothetical protein
MSEHDEKNGANRHWTVTEAWNCTSVSVEVKSLAAPRPCKTQSIQLKGKRTDKPTLEDLYGIPTSFEG